MPSLQENPIPDGESLRIPKLAQVIPPQADSGAIAEAAEAPGGGRGAADRRRPHGPHAGRHGRAWSSLPRRCNAPWWIASAELNFPSRHPLNQTFRRNVVVPQADVILAIEMNDQWAALNAFSDRIVRTSRPLYKPTAKIISLGLRDMYLKSNYQDFGRFSEVDLAIAGDGEASLPALTEAVRKLLDARPQVRLRGARQALRGGASRLARAGQIRRDHRLGREPDHDRADVRRGLCPDQGR